MATIVSKRAEVAKDWEDFFHRFITVCSSDPFDEKENPSGYINLGTSMNIMSADLMIPRITDEKIWHCDTSLLQLHEGYGIMRLREIFAKVMTEFLETHEPLLAENVFCVSGVTSCIDILSHCLADPKDVFLTPTPMYGRIYTNLKQRAEVDVWPIPVITEDDDVLTIEKVAKAYESAVAEGKTVRGIFLINPHNPLGDVYSSKLLMDILSFCHDHFLHVIVDEIYALSVFPGSEKFHSVLKFPKLPDPQRTHVLYGISKDFVISGLRTGVIHTTCEPLKKCLIQLCVFQNIPYPVMDIVARYLEDIDWLKEFVAKNQARLGEAYKTSVDFLRKMGLKVRESSAGFFLWVDFREICTTYEAELEFFEYLMETAHLYIGPGKEFFTDQPGWFRIVFTSDKAHLKEGLLRLEKAVKEFKSRNK